MKVLKVVLLFICLFSGESMNSQIMVPLDKDYSRILDNWIISNKINISAFAKPASLPFLSKNVNTDSLFSFGIPELQNKKSWFIRKLRYENFLHADTSDFSISVDPVFNLQYERNPKSEKNWYTNTRGIRIFGRAGTRLYFESSFYENQSTFPDYLNNYVNSSMVVPGQGFVRKFGAFDYSNATGSLLYLAGKHFEFSMGHGKFFIGEGYRSLFLSDNSFNYPYFRTTVNFNKLQYTRIMAVLMTDSTPNTSFGIRQKKLAGFNILTFLPNYWFHISFFEGTVWNFPESKNNISFDANYLNPVIFINSAFPGIKCKSVTGMALTFNILQRFQIYNQVAIDKSPSGMNSETHLSWQTGWKYFNVFSLKNLFLQVEFNFSPKESYESSSDILTYSHYFQPLADPLGTNFKELIFKIHYHLKRVQFNTQINFAEYGSDTISSVINLYQIPYIGNGNKTKLLFTDMNIAYLINPKTNMRLETGCVLRKADIPVGKQNITLFYISFKTSLTNWYYDF